MFFSLSISCLCVCRLVFFFFQAEDGIRDLVRSRGLGDVYKRQMQDVGATLSTLLGGNNVNRFAVEGRSYQVIPQVPRGERATTEQILKYHVRATNGDMVPLSSFMTLGQTVQPNSLKTFQQLNSATLQLSLIHISEPTRPY